MLALQWCIKQIFLFLLLWCKSGRSLTPLKEVNAMLPYCQHQHLCGQLEPWEPSSRIHCSQPVCVCLVVDEITCHWKNLDVVQPKKWIFSKLPIISRKLAVQTKYIPKNQKHRLLYNSDFFFWHVFSTDMAILIKAPQSWKIPELITQLHKNSLSHREVEGHFSPCEAAVPLCCTRCPAAAELAGVQPASLTISRNKHLSCAAFASNTQHEQTQRHTAALQRSGITAEKCKALSHTLFMILPQKHCSCKISSFTHAGPVGWHYLEQAL